MSPSTLSHLMRTLERNIGVRLLHRTTRSVSPTQAGESLVARLEPVLRDLERALQEVDALRGRSSDSARAQLAAGRLVCVLEEWCPPIPGLFLYYPGHRHVPPALRAFIDVVKETMADGDPAREH